MSTHSKFSPKVNHAKFGQTMKAQSVGRQSDDARTHFSHLATHKDSIKSDDHPTAFGISRHTIKQRTSPLPQNTLYHFSDHNTIKQTPTAGKQNAFDKPETASDFAVPEIKARGGGPGQAKGGGVLGATLTMRGGGGSPQTSLPVPVFSNLQQLKAQIAANQQRGRQKKRVQPTAHSTKSNGFGFVPLEATVKTHQPQVRQQLHDVLMGDIN